jgi:hypothetical protein
MLGAVKALFYTRISSRDGVVLSSYRVGLRLELLGAFCAVALPFPIA